jgi:predicted O-methyltransferase YrrM
MVQSKNILLKSIKNPGKAFVLAWRRIFPFGIIPKDPEAYRIGSWSYGNLKRIAITDIFKGIASSEVTVKNAFDKDIYTSMDMQEVFIVCSVLKFIGAKNIMEIGTFDGNTTLNLAVNSSQDAKITTVDLPPDWDGNYEINIPELYKNVTERNTVGRQFKEHQEYFPKIKQIFIDSANLDWNEAGAPFDLVILDGCHHYNYVLKDTENAIKFTKPGGIIIWHDYGMIQDVSKVVDDIARSIKVYAVRGTRLAIGFKP